MKATIEQEQIITSTEDRIIVSAAAGSGKTFTLIEKIRWELKNGVNPAKMVCITFTNNAAQEMKLRLGSDYTDEMFIGTIHSYANKILLESGISTSSAISNNKFDELFNIVMDNPQCIQEVDFLALDEAQDSSPLQFEFILDMIYPKRYLIVGDIRQSIYGFNGANPKIFASLFNDMYNTSYKLTLNYRNSISVLRYSKWILSIMKDDIIDTQITGRSTNPGLVETDISRQDLLNVFKKNTDYKNWTILCRSNAKVYKIISLLNSISVPSSTFKQADSDYETLMKKMEEDSVKVLTMHSAKGLEWNNVIVADQVWKSEEDLRLMYVAATRAKDKLYICK